MPSLQIEGVQLDSVECRATRCRVEATFDNHEADMRVMRQVFMSAEEGAIKSAFAVPTREVQPDGSVAATVYIYEQEEVPEPEPS